MFSTAPSAAAADAILGPLESRVMEIVWRNSEANVRQVAALLPEPLAYTTVMTTLDRLYKKGLLERRKKSRAFIYAPRVSRAQWLRRRAGEFVANFFATPHPEREALLSCLLDAVEQYDAALLDDLSQQIRDKRRQMEREAERT
ncbi:MAG TPA: BlaI/MecI/CopY family transcriptional regulator [Terriglobales bacterium]|jgi:predicted transcriptional regulator